MAADRLRRGEIRESATSEFRVTVVVVTYNSADVLPDLLQSLPNAMKGVGAWQLVIADNDSSDDSVDVARRHAPSASIVDMGRNAGYSAGLNAAVAAADDSDAVLLLNPDIRPQPGFGVALLSSLGDDVGIVAPRLLDEDGQLSYSLRREPSVLRSLGEAVLGGRRAGKMHQFGEVVRRHDQYQHAGTFDWASGAALMISRQCLADVGGWDESLFLYSEEAEFALRARDSGWKTRYNPAAVAVHIGGDSSRSPSLWALLTSNRVRLYRRRHHPVRAAGFWLATLFNEGVRAAAGSSTHQAGLCAVLGDPPTLTRRTRGRRVLIVVQNLPVPQDRRVWREARALTDAGFDVSVICPKADGDPAFERRDGVDLYKYSPPPSTRGVAAYMYEFAYCWLATARLTLRVLRRTGVDVFQACNPPDTYWVLALLLKPFGVTFVFDHHDLCPEVYQARFGRDDGFLLRGLFLLERATFAVADHVISTNESYLRIAMERGDLTARDTTVVRNGPDPVTMRRGESVPTLRKGRQFLCCYLGVMGPQDGVDIVIHATSRLVHTMGYDVHVALLGDGDCFTDLQALAAKLNVSDYVTFTGWADDRTIHAYLSTADIGLCPDPITAFNDLSTMNKTLEYMAYELPIVSFDLHETRASAERAAVYVTRNDSDEYAIEIANLLDSAGQREAMGKLGRQRIESGLSWDSQRALYVDAISKILGQL